MLIKIICTAKVPWLIYIYIMKCSLSLISNHMVSVCESGADLKFHICVCVCSRTTMCVCVYLIIIIFFKGRGGGGGGAGLQNISQLS